MYGYISFVWPLGYPSLRNYGFLLYLISMLRHPDKAPFANDTCLSQLKSLVVKKQREENRLSSLTRILLCILHQSQSSM